MTSAMMTGAVLGAQEESKNRRFKLSKKTISNERRPGGILDLKPNALTVLQKRYLKKGHDSQPIETPEDLFHRVAKHIAAADALYGKNPSDITSLEEKFYNLMVSLWFLPNSPTLMNAGRRLGQLSACFVLPIGDSMEEIFDGVKFSAIIHKSGGGTGFSFSRLRPAGDIVGSTRGVSSGPVSFMAVYNSATEAVRQGGTRRGANMGLLRVDHPDIMEFIHCKDDNNKFNNFNVSVGLTEEFMKAVEKNGEYDLVNPKDKKIVKRLKAREVFNTIVKQAWKNGEPGVVYLDRINATNPTPAIGEIESTNPCGEQPLLPYESCNLGSINLAKMVHNGQVDWDALRYTVHVAVHFLDNVIDVNKYPLKMIEEMTKANRKIGLGVMGWADMLIQLRIPYSSEDAIRLAEDVMGFVQREGREASVNLAKERGAFPNAHKSIYSDAGELPRNATVTTIAPTGTLSIIAGCSSGVEPLFALVYERTVLEGTNLYETNPYFIEDADNLGFHVESFFSEISRTGSIAHIDDFSRDLKRLYVTAHDISPEDHIKMQAAFQKFVDNAVSKTVNFPHAATLNDVEKAYMFAYKLGCKGVTVYRDGSRESQVLSTGKSKTVPQEVAPSEAIFAVPKKRPTILNGSSTLYKTGCGNMYVTVNQDEEGSPFEVFTNIGKAGGCVASQTEAIGRLISLCLRSGIKKEEVVSQLRGIRCHQPTWNKGGTITSCADAMGKAIEHFQSIKGNGSSPMVMADSLPYKEPLHMGCCPECGGTVEHEGGCAVCHGCGFTKC
jgi:ribonucleoside-diphosphate reductase alpha chain